MKAALVVIAAALVFASGCVKQQDWIDRTLVTVDVTGTWEGGLWLDLKQEGAKVKGWVRMHWGGMRSGSSLAMEQSPIEGTVAGDVFTFKALQGTLDGQMTVSADEMTGLVSTTTGGPRVLSLRRTKSPTPPDSPTR